MSKLLSPAEIANKIRRQGGFKNEKPDMAKVAKIFVNGELREAIEIHIAQSTITSDKSVMVNLPGDAYDDKDKFLAECNKLLTPHYNGEFSHDGVGMHDTLWVTWK